MKSISGIKIALTAVRLDSITPSCQTIDSWTRGSRDNSTGEVCSQWEILMRKFSADYKSKTTCRSSRVPPQNTSVAESASAFPTGSTYEGQWDVFGMSGYGIYTFPNGVVYEGDFDDGVFHGDGELRYPGGVTLRGKWRRGVMVSRSIEFEDGHEFSEEDCCHMPDRRFPVERQQKYRDQWDGLKPATKSYLTPEQPPREVPPGYYDTGSDLYDPNTGVAVHYDNMTEMVRALTPAEQEWTEQNCRTGEDKTTGARPDLYEQWWDCRPEAEDSMAQSLPASRRASLAWRDDDTPAAPWRRISASSAGWNRRIIKFDPDVVEDIDY